MHYQIIIPVLWNKIMKTMLSFIYYDPLMFFNMYRILAVESKFIDEVMQDLTSAHEKLGKSR